jgi:hypothetical protein
MKRVLAVVVISVALAALSPMQNAAEARQSATGEDQSAADTRPAAASASSASARTCQRNRALHELPDDC